MNGSRGRIPDGFIQDLLARTDIVQLIEARVKLKRAGREYSACCPFHNEKTPSFTVSPQKQFYHCFGCGAHGTAIGFLMEHDQLDFIDAVEVLAEQLGVPVPREGGGGRPQPGRELFEIMAQAEAFYVAELKRNPGAQEYLAARGIGPEVIERFRLGVSPDRWDTLVQRMGKLTDLESAGLAGRRSSGGGFDKFRARIMFPIHDLRGRPIAFGGRLYSADAEGPKYLNSPETELFHKGRELYGLYQAREARSGRDRLLVVEGYMDVVALAQHGIDWAVATLGTATTASHLRTLFRTTREVIFCFDGDRAGRQAAERAMDSALPELAEGRQIRFLFLPDGEDPDSLVQNGGAEALIDRLPRAAPFSDFFFSRYRAQVQMDSLDGRSQLVSLCRPQLDLMPAGAMKDMMFERLGQLARTQIHAPRGRPTPRRRVPAPGRISLVRAAIQALLQSPALAATPLPDGIEQLHQPGLDLLVDLHAWCARHPDAHTAQAITAFADSENGKHLGRLAALTLLSDEADLAGEFRGALRGLERAAIRSRLAELGASSSAANVESLKETIALNQRLKELEQASMSRPE